MTPPAGGALMPPGRAPFNAGQLARQSLVVLVAAGMGDARSQRAQVAPPKFDRQHAPDCSTVDQLLALWEAGCHVVGQLTISSMPAARAVRAICRPSCREAAIGFSIMTCTLCWAQASTTAGCCAFSAQQMTISIFSAPASRGSRHTTLARPSRPTQGADSMRGYSGPRAIPVPVPAYQRRPRARPVDGRRNARSDGDVHVGKANHADTIDLRHMCLSREQA